MGSLEICIGGERMLQLGVPKIYVGGSRRAKHTRHAKHANSRGVGGMPPPPPPRKILKIRCQEIEFGSIYGGFSC